MNDKSALRLGGAAAGHSQRSGVNRNVPTAYRIYQFTRKRLLKINLDVAYRNLEISSAAGLTAKME
ncbi:MAG: hypothetical protein P8182_04400 [Deltaproteobacteria bacterium]